MAAVTLSPNGLDQYLLPHEPQELLVATMDGVVALHRSADRWTAGERSLGGVHVSALLLDAGRDAVFAGSHGNGIFRRLGGGPWSPASDGLHSRNVFSLACAPSGAGLTLYAGTEPAYLFRSRDGAQTWDELTALRAVPDRERWNFPAPPHVAHTKHVDIDPRDSDTLYVSIEQGALLKSIDGGRSFRELRFQDPSYVLNKDAHRIVFNPRNPDELYLPGGDGIAHSRDAGETWERVATPAMRVGYPDATFCSPETDGILYASGGGTSPDKWRQTGDAAATVARSRDGGRTWEALPLPPLRGNIEAATLVSWPGGYGFFAGTTDGEVFASMDRGESWSLIAAELPPVSKCIHHRNLSIGRGAA
jgi:photosystem II stability/assembly factor-like uncharacterized protein